jgi:predicted RNA-binding Zn ribbon-like protein
MKADLPLKQGAPHFIWRGGRPAVDFLNTVRERWRRSIDVLVVPDDLAAWLAESGLLKRPPRASPEDLRAGRDLREAIGVCVDRTIAASPVPATAVREIDRWLPLAQHRARFLRSNGVPTYSTRAPDDAPSHGLALVALDAARMLGTDERDRIRVCDSETCGVRFFDRSPAGHRRWCSMKACGNVAKARRHRERAR